MLVIAEFRDATPMEVLIDVRVNRHEGLLMLPGWDQAIKVSLHFDVGLLD